MSYGPTNNWQAYEIVGCPGGKFAVAGDRTVKCIIIFWWCLLKDVVVILVLLEPTPRPRCNAHLHILLNTNNCNYIMI